MTKDILLLESMTVNGKNSYLYAEVEITVTDDSFDHEFGTEHCTGLDWEITSYYQTIENESCKSTGFSQIIDKKSMPEELQDFYYDLVEETINSMDDSEFEEEPDFDE